MKNLLATGGLDGRYLKSKMVQIFYTENGINQITFAC
jgi:hypothetical protein